MIIETKAYAKVNLNLDILNKRSDNYHNIFSLNASVDLFDRIVINRICFDEEPNSEISLEIIPIGGKFEDDIRKIPIKDNLIFKAVDLYCKRIKRTGNFSISIEKNIPTGSGLAGGSSDAAAILLVLNDYLNEISKDELLEIGSMIGADIPYCMTQGFAICEGIGDRIEEIDGKLDFWILIVNKGIHINTSNAYKALDRGYNIQNNDTEKKRRLFKNSINKGNIDQMIPFLKNDFEAIVFGDYPEILELKKEIKILGADYVTMTGSGSSLIGLFKDKRLAKLAEKELKKSVDFAIVTNFI